MIQNAIVKRVVRDGVTEVSLLRQMECGLHCDGACEGCSQKPKEEILALAVDPVGARPGDLVEVEPAGGHNIGTSVLVFLLPCVTMCAGYIMGQALFSLGEGAALGTAALGAFAGFIPALLLDRSIRRKQAPEFRILKLLR